MVGSCALLWKYESDVSDREFEPVVDRYLTRMNAGDYHRAYAEFGQALRDSVKEGDYVSIEGGIH
jgi:hypothetical protein